MDRRCEDNGAARDDVPEHPHLCAGGSGAGTASSRPVPVVRLHHPAPRVPWQGLTAGLHAAAPSSPREPRDGRTAWMGHGLYGHNRPGAGIRSSDTDAKGKRQGRGQGQQSWVEHGPEVGRKGTRGTAARVQSRECAEPSPDQSSPSSPRQDVAGTQRGLWPAAAPPSSAPRNPTRQDAARPIHATSIRIPYGHGHCRCCVETRRRHLLLGPWRRCGFGLSAEERHSIAGRRDWEMRCQSGAGEMASRSPVLADQASGSRCTEVGAGQHLARRQARLEVAWRFWPVPHAVCTAC